MGRHKKTNIPQKEEKPVFACEDPTPATTNVFKKILSLLSENKIVIGIFILCFVIYNTYTYVRMSGDTIPAAYLPFSIIFYHNPFFEQFSTGDIAANAYAFVNVNGHLMSIFPIVTPILITPFVFLCSFLMSPDNFTLYIWQIARTASAGIAALAVCIFYLVMIRLVPKKIATISSFIFAFATSTWSISSQALWQHGMVELLLLLMIFIIIKNEEEVSARSFVYLGIVSGLFIFCRPPDAILLIPVLGYVFLKERKYWASYIGTAIISGLPFLVYNLYYFGNVFGGYVQNIQKFDFGLNFLFNYMGLFVSPNKGLLIFSPILILAIFGYLRLNSIKNNNIMTLMQWFGPVLILNTLVYSFFGDWGGGYSYGPRFLTGLVPVLCIYAGIFLSDFQAHFRAGAYDYIKTGIIAVLLIISVVIQFTGVFYFPYLSDANNYAEPWDTGKPVILNSLNDGITHIDTFVIQSIPPLPPIFYYSASDYQSIMYATYAREAGDYRTAADYYKKSIKTNPDSYIVWNDLGSTEMRLGNYGDALQSYDRALALNPANEIVASNRAQALQSLQMYNGSQTVNSSNILKMNSS